jgi:hypothetical protein
MPRTDIQSLGLLETLVESAVRTANGDSGAIDGWGSTSKIRAQLEVTAASGTGQTLDVVIEDTVDGTNWNTIATFAQIAAPGREIINITSPFANKLRVRWTVGGTSPSFTFSVKTFSK